MEKWRYKYNSKTGDELQRQQCRLLEEQNELLGQGLAQLNRISALISAITFRPTSGAPSPASSAANPGGWQALFPQTEPTGD